MNTAQYKNYFEQSYDQMLDTLDGRKYKEISLLGNTAATMAANLMQKEENELAYKRSSAGNQVNLMRQAGMSRAGAINALNGGGSYTPAPVNVASTGTDAQNVRSQDMSNLFSALESFSANTAQLAQIQEQKRQFNLQHAEQKRQFNAEHALKQEEVNKRGKLIDEQINDIIATYTGKEFDNAIKNIEYRIASANESRRTSAEDAKYLAEEAQSALEALKAIKQTQAWEKMSSEQIAEYYELQAKLEILSNLGNTKATDLLAKILSIF